MKRLSLLPLLFLSLTLSAQKKQKNADDVYSGLPTNTKKHPAVRLGAGGATIGFGTLFASGGLVFAMEAKGQSARNGGYAITGIGAILAITGGIMMSNAGRDLALMNRTTRLKFTGSSLVLSF